MKDRCSRQENHISKSRCGAHAGNYSVVLRVTISATPRARAYAAKRNAPYFPPEAAWSLGMNLERLESTTASPIMPGTARRSMAEVQWGAGMFRHRRIAMHRMAERTGDRTK